MAYQGPQLDTTQAPWMRHATGELFHHPPWEGRPSDFSIPLPDGLPTLCKESSTSDVKHFLQILQDGPHIPISDAEILREQQIHINVYPREISCKDSEWRQRTIGSHTHEEDRADTEQLFACDDCDIGALDGGGSCMLLTEYSATASELATNAPSLARRGGLLALFACPMIFYQGWHSVALLVIDIPASELPGQAHTRADLVCNGRPRIRNPFVSKSDRAKDGIKRTFIYDPSYPHLGGSKDIPELVGPERQPQRSRLKHHIGLRTLAHFFAETKKQKDASWVAKNVRIGGGGNRHEVCCTMATHFIAQTQFLLASFHAAKSLLWKHGGVNAADSHWLHYHRALYSTLR